MKNKHFNLTSGIVLILIPLVFSFTGCKEDYETYYEGYGLVSKSGDEKFTVKLDDGYLLYPREYYFNPEKLNDSTRLRIRFNILEEQDTNLYARIVYAGIGGKQLRTVTLVRQIVTYIACHVDLVVQFLDGCYCFSVRNLIGHILQQITRLAVEQAANCVDCFP